MSVTAVDIQTNVTSLLQNKRSLHLRNESGVVCDARENPTTVLMNTWKTCGREKCKQFYPSPVPLPDMLIVAQPEIKHNHSKNHSFC